MKENIYKEALKLLISGKKFKEYKIDQYLHSIRVYDEDENLIDNFYVTNEEHEILNRALESLEDE